MIYKNNTTCEEQFEKPSKEYKGAPFWSWNGKLDKKRLVNKLTFLKKWDLVDFICIHAQVWKPSI